MTDTAESVRKLANTQIAQYSPAYHALHHFADLLERIEKAPVIQYYSSEDGYVIKGDDRPLYGKRVALVRVE